MKPYNEIEVRPDGFMRLFCCLKIHKMEEIWKDVPDYEGLYQVSSFGRLKSFKYGREKTLKGSLSKGGYVMFGLYSTKYNKFRAYCAHQLVAMAFLGHKPDGHRLVVDHINDDKLDNRVNNLQIVTQRFNARKTQGIYSSKYKGVSWNKLKNKFTAQIKINYKTKNLGFFDNEYDAHLAYENALKNLEQ